MLTEREKLDSLIGLGIELSLVNDLDILMERVLTRARQFVNADAGSIYIREADELRIAYTQNDSVQRSLPSGEKMIYSTIRLPIDDTSIAGYVAKTGRMLNIRDVYSLEPALPFRHGRRIDTASGYRSQSMLTIPLQNSSGQILGILQIINAQDEQSRITCFSQLDEAIMRHFAAVAAVALERAQMTRALILRMIRMAEMRDPTETGAHVNRVAAIAIEIYEEWALRRMLDRKQIDRSRDILRMAAMLHDVGKVAISDLILRKTERLDAREYEIMKQHTLCGARLFENRQSDFDEAAGSVAMNHHEHWDGTGYPGHVDPATGKPLAGWTTGVDGRPRGKREEEIPLFGRIVALADVFDALSSRRAYKKAWNEDKVLDQIHKGAGSHFDPEVVDIFFCRYELIRSICRQYEE